jgi:hypothetical protein
MSLFLLSPFSDRLVVVDDIFTALNKIVASNWVAGGLQIYVKMAFRNGPELEVSSFQCSKHSDSGHPGFEKFAPQVTEDLHEKWKAYSATVLEGICNFLPYFTSV